VLHACRARTRWQRRDFDKLIKPLDKFLDWLNFGIRLDGWRLAADCHHPANRGAARREPGGSPGWRGYVNFGWSLHKGGF
jgi:hypothetical protein